MAHFRKRNGKHQAIIKRKGFDPITKTFHRLADAKEWARQVEAQADRGELVVDRKVLEQITLAKLVNRYLESVTVNKRGQEAEAHTLNAFLRHPICKKRLSDLSPSDFARYRDERLRQVSPVTLKRQLNPLRHMFRLARDEWDIPVPDPLAKLHFKAVDVSRQRRLRAGELDLLLKHSKPGHIEGRDNQSNRNRNPYVPLVIRFALETAMRRGEILSLKWAQVDLPRHSLTVLESKNGYTRTIPVTGETEAIIREAGKLAYGDKDPELSARVFPVEVNAFHLAWSRLIRKTGIPDLHFHDLRHEAISRLFELGLTVPEVASISGHRDLRMLMRYSHATQSAIREKLGIGKTSNGEGV